VVTLPGTIGELLDRADAARAAGRGETAGRLYDEAAVRSQTENDLDGWTRAVLGAAAGYLFGAEPGRLPAQLHDVLVRTTDDSTRARLAAALARCWAYAGHPRRAAHFAAEALDSAQRVGTPELVADCLDAALAAHWGPDELEVRRSLAAQLDDVAAHVIDPDARLQAHLWGLHVACETLDVQAVHRQLRALERLGEESDRAMFFAASRRLMFDLMIGRTDTSRALIRSATKAAERAALPDAWLVLKAMEAYSAAQSGDTASCAASAAECEAFALAEGATVVCAEAGYLWVCAGEIERARVLVHSFHGRTLDDLPRDVNWLLTLQCVLESALAVGDRAVVGAAARLLTPYAGRAVFNAGAVMFHGVTDDTLARAAATLGDPESADQLRSRALHTYEVLGARWWLERLRTWRSPKPAPPCRDSVTHLHPTAGGLWVIGFADSVELMRPLRGFRYLRELLRRPGRPVSALDLVGGGTGVAVQPGLDGLDAQARTAYRQRLRDLEVELTEAAEWSDLGRLDAVNAERDALLTELAGVTGLGGRSRTTGSSQERARSAVKKAISAAIDRIATVEPRLSAHLKTTIHTGLTCTYQPDPADHRWDWILD
jgi:hypothetical protein